MFGDKTDGVHADEDEVETLDLFLVCDLSII